MERVFNREGGSPSTTLTWVQEGKLIEINLRFDASAVFSKKLNLVFVEAYADMEVQLYKLNGEFVEKYKIATLKHYSFRGLNQNINSKTGVSLLFHPDTSEVGNEWGDIEQYEFIKKDNTLGKYLNIYR